MPANTELCIPVSFGETERDPAIGVEVEAKREETEPLDVRYGSVDIEEAKEGPPSLCRALGRRREGVWEESGVDIGESLGGVIKATAGGF